MSLHPSPRHCAQCQWLDWHLQGIPGTPFLLRLMGRGLVGIRQITGFLNSQSCVDREGKKISQEKDVTEAVCLSKAHLPIWGLLFPDTFVFLHFSFLIILAPVTPSYHPFLTSIAGSSITLILSHLGLSQVEAACVRDYHTFVWSSVPESASDGSPVHASVQFQGTREDGKLGRRNQEDRGLEKGSGLRNIKVRHRTRKNKYK